MRERHKAIRAAPLRQHVAREGKERQGDEQGRIREPSELHGHNGEGNLSPSKARKGGGEQDGEERRPGKQQ